MKGPINTILIPGRGNAIRGFGLWKTVNGKLVWQRWPRRQPTSRTSAEARNRRLLRQAAIIAPYFDSYQQQFSRALAAQTQLAARDHLFIAMFGRIGTFIRPNGTKVYSMAAMQDVSAILDALAQTQNSMLVRGAAYWEGLPPGAEGQILTLDATGTPLWTTPTPSVGEPRLSQPVFTGFAGSTTPTATQGIDWFISEPITITGAMIYHAVAAGSQLMLTAGLAHLSGPNYVLDTVHNGPIVSPPLSGADQWTELTLTVPLVVPATQDIFIGVTRVGAGNTAPTGIGQGHGLAQNAPLPGRAAKSLNLAREAPAPGDVFSSNAPDNARGIAVLWHE